MGHPMRLELTRVDLLVQLANRYTTRGTLSYPGLDIGMIVAIFHDSENVPFIQISLNIFRS